MLLKQKEERPSSQVEAAGAAHVHIPAFSLCSQPRLYAYTYDAYMLCVHVPVGNTSSASLLEPQHSCFSQTCRIICFGTTEVAKEKHG